MADWDADSVRDTASNRSCVVFVHGFTGRAKETWAQFPEILAADPTFDDWDIRCFGYRSSLAPDVTGVWEGDPEIHSIAATLATFAGTALDRYKALILAAHSMGGLVVQRAVLDDPKLRERVDKIITFGTPSFGLRKALPFRLPILRNLKRQVRDMARGGDFITSLREQWHHDFGTQPPFAFLAVAGAEDEFVPRDASHGNFPDHQCAMVPGNHLEIVKPAQAEDASATLFVRFVRGENAAQHAFRSAALALERREFTQVKEKLNPHRDRLDRRARINLALALDALGERDEAMRMLEDAEKYGVEAMGVLAGRHKRNWLQTRIEDEAQTAESLYRDAYQTAIHDGNHVQAYYHGINLAYLSLVYRENPVEAKQFAAEVLNHCARAKEGESLKNAMWRRATEGEAHLIRSDLTAALAGYGAYIEGPPKPEPWQLSSTSEQALRLADYLADEPMASKLLELFRRR